jgi:voltage-gated potassium channel
MPGSRGMRLIRASRDRLPWLISAGAAMILAAGGGLAAAETDTVHGFWQGCWWALSLMTTVGFIESEPLTTAGRLISAVLMVSGFALLAIVTATIASAFVREEERPEEKALQELEQRVLGEVRAVNERLRAIEEGLERRDRKAD